MEPLVGTREQVIAKLWAARQAGQQVTMSAPQVLPDGRWSVVVEHRAATRRGSPLERRVRAPRCFGASGRWVAAGTVASLAAVGALVWAVWWVAAWVWTHRAAIIGAATVLIILAAVVVRATGVGRSGHCSGPNTGH